MRNPDRAKFTIDWDADAEPRSGASDADDLVGE